MDTHMNFLREDQTSIEAVRKVRGDKQYAHVGEIAEMSELDDFHFRPEAYDYDDSIWNGPLVEENHHGVVARFPALETGVDEQNNRLAKADLEVELKRYAEDLDKTAEQDHH